MSTYINSARAARELRQPRETLSLGELFGRGMPVFAAYELTGESSIEGGVRCEYAHHRFLDRTVVIRRLMPSPAGRPQHYYTFLQEIHAQAMLRHPAIAQVFDAGIYDDQPYAVLELPAGATLEDQVTWLSENGAGLDGGDALLIIDRLADLVEYAHRQGVRVHNLAPDNIVLTAIGTPVLVALGSPESPEYLRTSRHRLAISAPELLTGALSDHRSDIYALGALLYYALTGQPLFAGEVEEVLAQKHSGAQPQIAGLPQDVDAEAVERVIRKATALRLADRYASVSEFRYDLAAVLPGQALASAEAVEAGEAEPLLAREVGSSSVMFFEQPKVVTRPQPREPLLPAAQEAAPQLPVADPTAVPGADREELRSALAYTILVPLEAEPEAAQPAGAGHAAGAAAMQGVAERLSWLWVALVVATALGTALLLG